MNKPGRLSLRFYNTQNQTNRVMTRKQAVDSAESNSSLAIGNYEDTSGKKMVLITITDEASNVAPSEESDLEVETDEATTMAKNVKI